MSDYIPSNIPEGPGMSLPKPFARLATRLFKSNKNHQERLPE